VTPWQARKTGRLKWISSGSRQRYPESPALLAAGVAPRLYPPSASLCSPEPPLVSVIAILSGGKLLT
jgi:hypothetical protein